MRLPAAILLASAAALAAPPALAQGKKTPPAKTDPRMAEAKKLFDEGAAAYAQGNYEDAIRAWEKSFELSEKPLIFESIANAWERLGDARKARDNLAKWRAAAPAEERSLLDARIKNLDARVQREEDAERKAAEEKARREAQQKAAEAEKHRRPWLPWVILAGSGGALAVAGVAVDVVAKTKRPPSGDCADVNGKTFCKSTAADAVKSSNTLAIVGDALWITGAAAAAAGVTLIFVLKPKDQTPATTGYITPAAGGFVMGARF